MSKLLHPPTHLLRVKTHFEGGGVVLVRRVLLQLANVLSRWVGGWVGEWTDGLPQPASQQARSQSLPHPPTLSLPIRTAWMRRMAGFFTLPLGAGEGAESPILWCHKVEAVRFRIGGLGAAAPAACGRGRGTGGLW